MSEVPGRSSDDRTSDEGARPERSVLGLIAIVVAVVVGTYAAVDSLLRDLAVHGTLDMAIEGSALGVGAGVSLWFLVLSPLRRDADRERALNRVHAMELREDAERQEFGSRVHRAMDMAGTEETAHRAVERALHRGAPRLAAELLLADSSDAHLKPAAHAAPDGNAPGCSVTSPRECPAIRRSQSLIFTSAQEIDACPHLAGRPEGDRAAACVPVSVAGRSIGVLHATTDPAEPPTPVEVTRLETLATQAGARLGILRVMEATHLQAATDPLTGLLNRRSFENQLQELLRRRDPLTLAMGDLDHFKALNDTHGHDVGDRALRLFARTMRQAVRADDLVCRYGGEEFVIAFPGLTAETASRTLGRVQEQLVLALAAGSVPPFTASFGIAQAGAGDTLEELCRTADVALFRAKREGRNRIVVDPAAVAGPGVDG